MSGSSVDHTAAASALESASIRCPSCRNGPLARQEQETSLACPLCTSAYPVRDGVVDLLDREPRTRSVAQRTMEWEPIVRIYESRLWRRGLVFSTALGVTFEEEHRLVERALLVPGVRRLLDLGCGPGIHTRPFARALSGGLAVGLDLSMPMLRYASQHARRDGIDNVAWIHGDALDPPFADESFDAVSCCGALHLFPDVGRALREIHRVLRPGSRFATAIFRRASGGLLSRWDRSFDEDVLGMASFSSAGFAAALRAAGFEDLQCHHDRRIWLIMSAARPAHPPTARSLPVS
jgi:SAM-dependent methyltransferase